MRRNVAIAVVVAAVALLVAWLWSGKQESAQSDASTAAREDRNRAVAGDLRDPVFARTPTPIGGRVVDDETGRGIPGALVSLTEKSLDGGAFGRPGQTPAPLTAVTDETGAWRYLRLPPGRYAIGATAARYVPGTLDNVTILPNQGRDDLVIRLRAGGHALTGTVSDIGGGPIGGATVRAIPLSKASVMNLPWANFATVTDADGTYSLHLDSGVYQLTVAHPDYVEAERTTELRDGPRREDFKLSPGAAIFGQVVTRADGEPVPDALVTETSAMGGFFLSGVGFGGATTDDQGNFVLRGLKSGALELRAVARGYTSTAPTIVEVGIGEQVTGVIVMVDKAYNISGTVVREGTEETPVEGVLVGAYNFRPGAALVATRQTASDGFFEILGVPTGSYVMGALGEEDVPNFSATNVRVKDEDVTDVVVRLSPGVTLRGSVDPPGPANVRVEIDTENIGMFNIMSTAQRAILAAQADEDGNFELKAVTPGNIVLAATNEDGAKGTVDVEVGDRDIDGLLIHLEPRPYVAGRVVDADGNPVTDVRVEIRPRKGSGTFMSFGLGDGFGSQGRPTNERGEFKVTGLDPGEHDVSVRDDRGTLAWAAPAKGKRDARAPKRIDVGETPTEGLELAVETRDGVIRGLVLGPDGSPVQDAWVTAQRTSPGLARMRERARKRKSKSKSKADDDDDSGEKRRSITVSVGEGGASAESKEETGPREDPEVAMRDWSGPETPVLTDAEGRFEIVNLRDGTYDLEAEGLRGTTHAKKEGVRVGADVVLTLGAYAGVEGTVTSAGQPVGDYTLQVTGPTSRRTHIIEPSGHYRVSRLEPGEYTVSVTSERGSAQGDVTVTAAATATLDLTIAAYGSVSGRVVNSETGEPIEGLVAFAQTDGATDFGDTAMGIVTGDGPKTDANGRFRVPHLSAGTGSVMIVDGEVGGFQIVASKDITLAPGQDLDVGELRGIPAGRVPKDERGTLGLDTRTATWADRPLAEGEDRGDEPPADIPADATLLWIAAVTEGGPAEAEGLEVADRVVAVNGIPVDGIGANVVAQLLSSERIRIGDQVTLEVARGTERTTYTVTAVARPAE